MEVSCKAIPQRTCDPFPFGNPSLIQVNFERTSNPLESVDLNPFGFQLSFCWVTSLWVEGEIRAYVTIFIFVDYLSGKLCYLIFDCPSFDCVGSLLTVYLESWWRNLCFSFVLIFSCLVSYLLAICLEHWSQVYIHFQFKKINLI